MSALDVVIQRDDFDVEQLQGMLQSASTDAGAIASFTGYVREGGDLGQLTELELEHYPGMTEKAITEVLEEAASRWNILGARVIHRVGSLRPGDKIVWVGVSASHRGDAFAACEFAMDYLKTRAPFWKKEIAAEGAQWVSARESDNRRARRWNS